MIITNQFPEISPLGKNNLVANCYYNPPGNCPISPYQGALFESVVFLSLLVYDGFLEGNHHQPIPCNFNFGKKKSCYKVLHTSYNPPSFPEKSGHLSRPKNCPPWQQRNDHHGDDETSTTALLHCQGQTGH